jgi:hypothetical protein
MKLKKLLTLALSLLLSGVFYGCATKATNTSASSGPSTKAGKKISMAIGQEVDEFTIADQQTVEAPAGYNGTQYTVKTKDGKTYKCEILEPSGLGQVASWGMASGADAMCTDFTKGSVDRGQTNKASCNALLQAAGKC